MNDSAYPIRLVVTGDLRRSRLTVFFRYLLALPHVVWLSLYGIAVYVVLLVAWFAALFMGRVPAGMHGFIAGYLRYSTRVNAYLYLVANPFPPFGAGGHYPVDLEVAGPEPQGRVGIFFRVLLALPALMLAGVLGYAPLRRRFPQLVLRSLHGTNEPRDARPGGLLSWTTSSGRPATTSC